MNTSRISVAGGGLIIAVAVLTDAAQAGLILIPFVGWLFALLVSFVAPMVFGVWFSHNDVSLMAPQRALGFLGTLTGELVPFLDGIPFWTSFVTYTVIQEWRSPEEI